MAITRTSLRIATPGLALIAFWLLIQSSAWASEALLLTGYTIDSQSDSNSGVENASPGGLNSALSQLGIQSDSEASIKAQAMVDEYFKNLGATTGPSQSFAILYTSCMMSMATESGVSSIRMPPVPEPVYLEAWDNSSFEAFTARFLRLAGTETVTDDQENSALIFKLIANDRNESQLGLPVTGFDLQTSPAGEARHEETTGSSSSIAQETGTEDKQSAEPTGMETQGITINQAELGVIAPSVNIRKSHSAWVAENVKGEEIYQQFFKAFVGTVAPGQEENLLYQGLLKRQVSMLQKGLPLHFVDTTVSIVGDKVMHTRTLESWASSIQLIELDEHACAASSIPDGYQVTRMNF
jgi:hypothetical protein